MKLKVLGLGSGLLVLLAVAAFAVNQWMASPGGQGRLGQPVMTGVDTNQVRKIEIVSSDVTVTLTSPDGRDWRVTQQDDYPVDVEKIQGLLLKLSSQKLAHLVTENLDHLGDLGLLTVAENGGKVDAQKTARVLRLDGADGKPLFELLVGKERRTPDGTGSGGIYVRYPGSPAAYLISEALVTQFRPQDWIDTKVLELDAGKDIKSVRIVRAGKRTVQLSHEKAGALWQLEGMPAAQLDQDAAVRVAAQVAGLDVFKVRKGDAPAAETGRAKTGQVTCELFDGRRFLLDIGEAKAGDDFRYLTLRAELAPGVSDDTLKQQVRDFNARFQKRLLAVYDWDGNRMLEDFDAFRVKAKEPQK